MVSCVWVWGYMRDEQVQQDLLGFEASVRELYILQPCTIWGWMCCKMHLGYGARQKEAGLLAGWIWVDTCLCKSDMPTHGGSLLY